MFLKMYRCDKCHKLFPAADQATTQLSYTKKEDNSPTRFDLCEDCLVDVIFYITNSGIKPSVSTEDQAFNRVYNIKNKYQEAQSQSLLFAPAFSFIFLFLSD